MEHRAAATQVKVRTSVPTSPRRVPHKSPPKGQPHSSAIVPLFLLKAEYQTERFALGASWMGVPGIKDRVRIPLHRRTYLATFGNDQRSS